MPGGHVIYFLLDSVWMALIELMSWRLCVLQVSDCVIPGPLVGYIFYGAAYERRAKRLLLLVGTKSGFTSCDNRATAYDCHCHSMVVCSSPLSRRAEQDHGRHPGSRVWGPASGLCQVAQVELLPAQSPLCSDIAAAVRLTSTVKQRMNKRQFFACSAMLVSVNFNYKIFFSSLRTPLEIYSVLMLLKPFQDVFLSKIWVKC